MGLFFSNFFGSNDSQINPHMRAKFDCSQTVVAEKRGVQTHRGTLQLALALAVGVSGLSYRLACIDCYRACV